MNRVSGIHLFEKITFTEAHTPIIPGLRRLRKEGHKFQVAGLQVHSRNCRGEEGGRETQAPEEKA